MLSNILGLLILISALGAVLWLVSTERLRYDQLRKFTAAQPELVGERSWELDVRPELLKLLTTLHLRSGEVLEELRRANTGDCGELLLGLLPDISWKLGEKYCAAVSAPQHLNTGLWFQSTAGEWHSSLEHAGKVIAVSFLGRVIEVSNEGHNKLQLNACRFSRHDEVKMRSMDSLPNGAWVVLRRRCQDGLTFLVSGFISSGVRHDARCTLGEVAGSDQKQAVTLYDGWAPLLVDNS